MSLTESIVDDAAPEWFGELGYAIGHGPNIAPVEMAPELNSFAGSPPFSRTLTRRPIEAMRSVHVEAKEVQCGVQARCG